MSDDLGTKLRRAAPSPDGGPDIARIMRGGRRLRGQRILMIAVTGACALGLVAFGLNRASFSDVEPLPVGPRPVPEITPQPKSNGKIAFVRHRAIPGEPAADFTAAIMIANANGSGVERLAPASYHDTVSWSPDGRLIAYLSDSLMTLDVRTGKVRKIVGCRRACGRPAWSPDGARLAFVSGKRLWTVDADGSNRRPLWDSGPPVSDSTAPAWSPDGRVIAAASSLGGGGFESIMGFGTRPGRQARIEWEVQPERSGFLGGLTWAPTGRRLAYSVTFDTTGGAVYETDFEAGRGERLVECTPSAGCDRVTDPQFSPDGEKMVFTKARCDERGSDCSLGDIVVLDLASRRTKTIIRKGLDASPAWQPVTPE